VATDGVVPLSPSLDHVGCFAADAATVERAARVLGAPWHPATFAARPALGVPTGPYLARLEPEGASHFSLCVEALRGRGYTVREVEAMADFEVIVERHRRLVAADAAHVHAEWYPRHRHLYDPRTAELIERGLGVSEAQRRLDAAGREELRADLERRMDSAGVDLWISPPALGAAPRGLQSTGDPIMNLPWTHAGLPTLVVAAGRGRDSGMPIGLQIAARLGADELLCAWAVEIEKEIGGQVIQFVQPSGHETGRAN
jgi:Asp-tRNA(Asn)/Glu-tRNA(Gln) amidotransferase A subunit family amidase